MVSIGIYVEPVGTGIGGSETVVAVLAEALAKNHQVDLLHHIPSLSTEHLAESSGTDLKNVTLRYVEWDPNATQFSRRNPFQHYLASRRWHATLSEPYDVFIAVVHSVPPFCHAAKGALIVLFPASPAPYVNPQGGMFLKSAFRHPARWLYQNWEWKRRMASYQLKTAISDFSRGWTLRRWRVNCRVVYPPVDTDFRNVEKERVILSVGRFAIDGEGHTKKQRETLAAFRQMENDGLQDWKYFCVGGLRDTPEHRAYFGELRGINAGNGSQLIANIERDQLRSLYERARIFWHAAGYGEDESTRPILVEHFGISTVEAMAAGCVPVVINKGGQREIVQHGVNGFLWDTLEELKEYTAMLMNDDKLHARMAEAARESARLYSREIFVENFLRLIGPLS
ncbi:MAG: glycosyltransferase family 4 protein [Acidobacteriota bacterium]|nr:glycosyltransferase family 4 protein [Acidobacteriota bacterium]